MTTQILRKLIALPQVRLSYPYLFAKSPTKIMDGSAKPGNYQAQLILYKDNIKHGDAKVQMEAAEKEILKSVSLRKSAHAIIRDNDSFLEEFDEDSGSKLEYLANTWCFNTSNNSEPRLEFERGVPLNVNADPNPFYPGCYVNVVIQMSPYKLNGKYAGVGKYLQYVLFAKHGENLGSKPLDGASFFTDKDCENVMFSGNANIIASANMF